jgi:hypothetical protein
LEAPEQRQRGQRTKPEAHVHPDLPEELLSS